MAMIQQNGPNFRSAIARAQGEEGRFEFSQGEEQGGDRHTGLRGAATKSKTAPVILKKVVDSMK